MKEKYKNDVKMIFDIASKEFVDRLQKNRLLVDRSQPVDKQKQKLEEDVAFLADPYGPRLGSMGPVDTKYAEKAGNVIKRQKQDIEVKQKHLKASSEEVEARKVLKEDQKRSAAEVEDVASDDEFKLLYNVKKPKNSDSGASNKPLELPRSYKYA